MDIAQRLGYFIAVTVFGFLGLLVVMLGVTATVAVFRFMTSVIFGSGC